MNIVTIEVEGMKCSMCESHVADAIRKAIPTAKKVTASRAAGTATFITDNIEDEEKAKEAVAATGYSVVSSSSEPYKKKRLFGK